MTTYLHLNCPSLSKIPTLNSSGTRKETQPSAGPTYIPSLGTQGNLAFFCYAQHYLRAGEELTDSHFTHFLPYILIC